MATVLLRSLSLDAEARAADPPLGVGLLLGLFVLAGTGLVGGPAQAQQLGAERPQNELMNVLVSKKVTFWGRFGDGLQFRPDGAPRPAGDVNGDGKEDWVVKSTATGAGRSADPSDRTTKTLLVYGGGSPTSVSQSQVYSHDLTPVGNFIGEGQADAVAVTRRGVQIYRAPGEVYGDRFNESGGRPERGYQKAGTITASLGAPDAVASTDLDNDGYDDIVLVSASQSAFTVLYGGQTREDVSVQQYDPSTGAGQYAHNVRDVDGDGHGEIVRISGSGTLTIEIFEMDDTRALGTQQSFSTSAFALGAQYVEIDLQDIDGANLTEIIARAGTSTQVFTSDGTGSYDATPIAYRSYLRPAGDLNGDGRADFVIRDNNGEPFLAFGPSTVSDGLSPDLKLPKPSNLVTTNVRYGNPTGPSHSGVTVGDLKGDAHQDVMIGELAGDDHHEVFREDVNNDNRQNVMLGDLSRSGDFSSTGGLPTDLSLEDLNDSDRLNLLLDDQNHLLDHLFRSRQKDVHLKDLNGDRPTGDLDGDGKGEVVLSRQSLYKGFVPVIGRTQIGVNEDTIETSGAGAFADDLTNGETFESYGRSRPNQALNVGDWDGDDTTDVAILRNQPNPRKRVWVYTNDPNQIDATDDPYTKLYSDDTTGTIRGAGSMAAGDFDDDSSPNLAVAWPQKNAGDLKDHVVGVYDPGADGPRMRIALSDLGISTTAPGLDGEHSFPQATVASVGDVNDDGTEDLAVAVPNAFSTASTAVFLYLNLSDATPEVTIDYSDDGASYGVGQSIEGVGDVNGDGIDDFVVGDAYYDGGPSGTLGAMYVHYGQSASTPSFGAPDEVITPSAASGENLQYFPWGIASGDFNADDTTDVAAKPLVFEDGSMRGAKGIHVYHGGTDFDGTPEQKLAIPARPLDAVGYMEGQDAYFNYGELTTVPPDGSGADRLLVGTHFASNALIYANSGSGLTPSRVLRAKDNRAGLGAGSPFMNLPNNESSAVGDFNKNGQVNLVLPQPFFPSYQASPAYAYELDAGSSGNSAPVAAADSYKTTVADLYKSAATQHDSLEVTPGSGVLANDSDPDSTDALTAALVNDVSNGTLTLSADGGFKYVPDAGFSGEDQFTYEAQDGRGGTAQATVTLRVIPETAPDAVTAVRPTSAAPGEPVRIHGNGFTPTASGNTVTIGGTQATVDSATGSTIYARVPSGVSGPSSLEVTSDNVTKTLSGPFTAVTGGQPSFRRIENSRPPIFPSTTAWGDFDGDGDLDFAIAGTDTSGTGNTPTTKIYRNDGTGRFTEVGADISGVNSRGDLEWGDYDRDGDLDLLVTGTTQSGAHAEIYRNDTGSGSGTGSVTFTPLDQLPPFRFSSADWGDMDGDGDLDLVVSGLIQAGEVNVPRTIIFENEGDDEFAPLGAGLVGVRGGDVAWGDYDGDGALDLVVAGRASMSPSARTVLYRNGGEGTFTRTFARLDGVRGEADLAWGDYNGDGDLDLVVTGQNRSGSASTTIYKNQDDRFRALEADLTGVTGGSVDWGDYDGDGDLDLLATGEPPLSSERTQVTTVYENRGTDTFARLDSGLPNAGGGDVDWVDVDADGDLDAFLTGDAITSTGSDTLATVYENTPPYLRTAEARPGSGTEGTPVTLYGSGFDTTETNNTVTFGGTQASVEEVTYRSLRTTVPSGVTGPVTVAVDNGDSTETITRRFLATKGATGVYPIVENTGLSGLGDGGDGTSLDWGDYDDDGDLDLAMAGYDGDFNTARIYENVGDGAFLQVNAGIDLVWDVKWGDYDGDGDLDLLTVGEHNTHTGFKIYRNDGSDTFTAVDVLDVSTTNGSMDWGDYDGDGDLDVVLNGEINNERSTRIYRNDDGNFTKIGADVVGTERGVARWGDYDSDGDLDLVVTGAEELSVGVSTPVVYRNNGDGNFTPVDLGLDGVKESKAEWGDYNRDGKLDLLIYVQRTERGADPALLTLFENKGDTQFEKVESGLAEKSFDTVKWGDYDGDGDLDLFANGRDETEIYRNLGERGFRRVDTDLSSWDRDARGQWGDFNGDGALDLVLVGENSDNQPDVELYRGVPQGVDVPGAPSDLAAEAPEDSVALSWTPSSASDAEEYRIYRDTTAIDAVPEGALDTVSADRTTYVDTTAAPDVVYRYRVSAVDTLGHESALTGEVQAMLDGVTIAGLKTTAGWSLASVPVNAPDSGFADVLPQCESGFRFSAADGYLSISGGDPVAPGDGVFANCTDGTTAVTGRVPDTATVDVDAGWNLIGPHVDSVSVSGITSDPSGIVSSKFYGLDQGYAAVDNLAPGEGYWVRADEAGTLDLTGGISSKAAGTAPAGSGSEYEAAGVALTVTDATGRSATLRLARSLSDQQKNRHALPPVPPGETFDVRFAGGQRAAAFAGESPTGDEEVSFRSVTLQGAAYPLQVRLQEAHDGETVLLRRGGPSAASTRLSPDGAGATVRTGDAPIAVALRPAPDQFALKKSYPNPTTDRSTIEYAVPEQTEVTLEVYDVLGRRVATLVDDQKRAGRYSTRLDAGRLSSGTYFYRLRAGDFTKTRRLVIVR